MKKIIFASIIMLNTVFSSCNENKQNHTIDDKLSSPDTTVLVILTNSDKYDIYGKFERTDIYEQLNIQADTLNIIRDTTIIGNLNYILLPFYKGELESLRISIKGRRLTNIGRDGEEVKMDVYEAGSGVFKKYWFKTTIKDTVINGNKSVILQPDVKFQAVEMNDEGIHNK